ncbi:MAG: NERD domain-containing protein [Clostridia bacterium]|nr:NERD domain-containing protein [Clostridia bacterium]
MIAFLIILAIVIAAGLLIFLFSKHGNQSYEKSKRTVEERGKAGEQAVARSLIQIAGVDGKLINNFIFKGTRTTVQIDHILICDFGIFVIETKNYSGIIYGDENRKEWLQVFPNSVRREKFHNPVKQNAGHVYNLRRILPKGTPVYGIVVFVQDNVQHVTAESVIGLASLQAEINRKNNGKVFTQMQLLKIYEILCMRNETKISNEQHTENVRKMIADVESNSFCPRCGGELVEKFGPYGKFIGCSNYPKCKFTKDL